MSREGREVREAIKDSALTQFLNASLIPTMRLLKLFLMLVVSFALGGLAGYKFGIEIGSLREFKDMSKRVICVSEAKLALNGATAFTAYRTNRNDAVAYLLSEHIADLERQLKTFPKNVPDDQVGAIYARRDFVGGIVLNCGRLAMLKGDREGEEYVQKALQLSVNWSPVTKYRPVFDKNSLFNYVKAKDAANEIW